MIRCRSFHVAVHFWNLKSDLHVFSCFALIFGGGDSHFSGRIPATFDPKTSSLVVVSSSSTGAAPPRKAQSSLRSKLDKTEDGWSPKRKQYPVVIGCFVWGFVGSVKVSRKGMFDDEIPQLPLWPFSLRTLKASCAATKLGNWVKLSASRCSSCLPNKTRLLLDVAKESCVVRFHRLCWSLLFFDIASLKYVSIISLSLHMVEYMNLIHPFSRWPQKMGDCFKSIWQAGKWITWRFVFSLLVMISRQIISIWKYYLGRNGGNVPLLWLWFPTSVSSHSS